MLVDASVELPEPSFLDRLADLESRIGRGPHSKDRWGRDPDDDDDSDNGLSDGAMERLWEQDEVAMRDRLDRTNPKSARERSSATRVGRGQGKARQDNTKRKREADGATDAQARATQDKKRRTEPSSPPGPLLAEPARRRHPPTTGRDIEEDRMQVEEPLLPVAGPSGHNSRRQFFGPDAVAPPPPHRTRPTSPPIVETTTTRTVEASSDSDRAEPSRKPKPSAPSSKPTPTASTSAMTARTSRGGKGKTKARPSMEQAIVEAQKIKPDELKTRFPDIPAFIDHLSSFELDRPGKLLEGCRIVFVNADHWKVNGGVGGGTRNRLDQGLRLELGIVARQGGTIVKPRDFVASPREATSVAMTERELHRRADDEGWTTHIIGYHPTTFRPPTFDEVLDCLGDEGVSAEELGPFVKVVTFPWVSETVKARKRRSEWEFAIEGDPREAPPSRVSSAKSSPTKQDKAKSAGDRRQGRKKRGPEDGGDTTGESQGDDDDGYAHGAVSPFGSQDYPAGERPATPGLSGEDGAEDEGDGDDPFSELLAPSTTQNPLEGLEEQSKLVKELGDEQVDGLLHEGYMIYRGADDDDETQNEADEEQARREGREVERPNLREKNPDRKGYVVNRKFAPPGSNNGPNDAVADVLMQLADFHKGDGDEWRTRGYRMAAGQLRSLSHKVTDYKELIKIRGIGTQIAEKIVEIHKTGTHRKLQNELPESKAARLFSNVYGIGPALGLTLAKRGAKTIDDLRKEDIFKTLTVDQQIGLKYYDDLLERIPRDEVTELYKIVLAAAQEVDPKLQVDCMGSYRRKAPNSGDIDILVTRDPTEDGKTHSGAIGKMYKILRANHFFQHILSQSDDWSDLTCKVNGLCKLPGGKIRRIDILGVPWEDMPAALIYFTGNDHFNRSLRLKARHMGYSLNQKCLSRSIIRDKSGEKLTEGERIHVKSERDIFRILKVPYKLPEERIPS